LRSCQIRKQLAAPILHAFHSSRRIILAVEVSNRPGHAKDEIEGVIATQAPQSGGGLIVMPAAFN